MSSPAPNHRRVQLRRDQKDGWIAFTTSLVLHTFLCLVLAFTITIGAGNRGRAGGGGLIEGSIGTPTSGLEALEVLEPRASLIAPDAETDPLSIAPTSSEQLIDQFEFQDSIQHQPSVSFASSATLESTSHAKFPNRTLSALSATNDSEKGQGAHGKGNSFEAGQGRGTDGIATGEMGQAGQGNSASFFGATAQGKKFVFVIDMSTSMRGERWRALCAELDRVLRSLAKDQKFFILGFDAHPHPMFGKFPPSGKYLQSNASTQKRVKNWLKSIELGRRTYPAQALFIALQLAPDAIFLLSDGELMDNTVKELRKYNFVEEGSSYSWSVPIHTILLHSQLGFETLETIALENNGTFTPVDIKKD